MRGIGERPTLVTVQLEPVRLEHGRVRTRLRLRHEHVTRLESGAGWHAYLEGPAGHLADPAAERDRDAWARRFDELEPAYAARFAALTPPGPSRSA